MDAGSKINTATPEDIDEVLFLSNKMGFTVDYLKYHSMLEFRAFASTRAVQDIYQSVFNVDLSDASSWFRNRHSDVICYWMALQELTPLKLHSSIVIGDEITGDALAAYDSFLHEKVFPPRDRSKVRELVADGHAKVHVKCCAAKIHAGRPRANGKSKLYGYGWFMLVNPSNQRILSVVCMDKPEGNEVMVNALDKILHKYKQVNGIVLDRACSFITRAKSIEKFHQIKYWCVDYFHARGHRKSCPCNPHFVTKLHRRFKDVNTSAAEQVFSWFRNYSRILNESRPSRHEFKALLFAKWHDQAVKDKKTGYLNQFSHASASMLLLPMPARRSQLPAARRSQLPAEQSSWQCPCLKSSVFLAMSMSEILNGLIRLFLMILQVVQGCCHYNNIIVSGQVLSSRVSCSYP